MGAEEFSFYMEEFEKLIFGSLAIDGDMVREKIQPHL